MPKIVVTKAFNLILNTSGSKLRFEPGVHEVSDEVAEHWYTKEHLAADEAEPVEAEAATDEPKPGRRRRVPAEPTAAEPAEAAEPVEPVATEPEASGAEPTASEPEAPTPETIQPA